MRAKPFPPMLPWKRPTWVLVLLAMLVFGFYQKFAKVHLNHYAQTLSMYPEMDAVDAETRAAWWNELNQPKRVHYYILDGTWEEFHRMTIRQLTWGKWLLSAGILLVFFLLDGLFLQTTGHIKRWPWLVVIYLLAGVVMLVFALAVPLRMGYSVVHEFLSFLQSPLPSLMIVLVPTLFERMREMERS
jgi:hypothetical protein